MKQIKIVEETEKETFQNNVNNLLKDGWELHGIMQVISYDTKIDPEITTIEMIYIQALTKHIGSGVTVGCIRM